MSVPPGPGPADPWLAARPGPDAVLVLPMYEPHAAHLESLRLFGSTAHWRPLVNGYAGVFPPGYARDVGTLNTFPAPAAVARLRALYVRYVVVHLGQYPRGAAGSARAALEAPAARRHARRGVPSTPRSSRSAPRGRERQARRVVRTKSRARSSTAGIDEAGRLERVEARGDREHRVEAVALRREPLARALLAVDQDHEILDHEARGLERLDRLELRRPVGDDVVDHHDALARLERALDPPAGAVRLLLAPRVDERDAARPGSPRRRAAGRRTGCPRSGRPGSGRPRPP